MKQVWIRRGHLIIDPDGRTHDHKTINKAKKASLDLQKGGSIVRVEEVKRVRPRINPGRPQRTRSFLSRGEERRFSSMQMAKFTKELTQDQLAEIAKHLHD